MKTVTFYDEAEWLKWRRGGISASDAAIIAGETTRPSRVELWLEKLGKRVPMEANEAMRFGKAMEGAIAEMYRWRTEDRVIKTQICGEADGTPYPMRATLDAITESGKILEFKAVSIGGARWWPEDGDAENLPPRVIYQVQHQMRVADKDSCTVVAAIPLELRLYVVQRREDILKPLMEMEEQFWHCIQDKRYPLPVMDEDAEVFIKAMGVRDQAVSLGMEVQDTVDAYERIGAEVRELETEKKRLKDRILSAMFSYRYGLLPDGRTIDCNLIDIPARIQNVKAYTQLRLTVKKARDGR